MCTENHNRISFIPQTGFQNIVELIGYARVSTREQHIEGQLRELVESGCTRVFQDRGSGKTARDRTKLGLMLDYIRPGDVVVVTKLDRLSRSLIDLLRISERIDLSGAHLRSLSEGFDTTTPVGKVMFHTMGTLAEFERERIRERTLEGLRQARAEGRIGGRPPKLNERQRRIVRRMRGDGESLREIARTLNVSVGTVTRVLKA